MYLYPFQSQTVAKFDCRTGTTFELGFDSNELHAAWTYPIAEHYLTLFRQVQDNFQSQDELFEAYKHP